MDETHSEDESSSPSNFAPRGASRFQERVRNKLPKPLDLSGTRQKAVVGKLYNACSVRSNFPIQNMDHTHRALFLVCPERPPRSRRQRAISGTIRIRHRCFAVVERTQRTILRVRRRCLVGFTTSRTPFPLHSVRATRCYSYCHNIFFNRLVTTLGQTTDRLRA